MEEKNPKSSEKSLLKTEKLELVRDFSKTILNMSFALEDLQKIKDTKNILFFVNKNGDLSMDVPKNMTDAEAKSISNKVSDLDSTYNERLDFYKKLLDTDKAFNKGKIGEDFKIPYQFLTEKHAKIFSNK